MINKKNLPVIIIVLLIISVGFVKINMINTKALSPIGNAEENYEKIINEFGEEFEEFIKDNSYIKIYGDKDSEGRITVKVGKKEVFIKDSNIVIEKVKEYYNYFITGYKVVKEDIEVKITSLKKEKKVIEDEEELINVNSEVNEEGEKINNEEEKEINNEKSAQNKLDKIVEDFMENRE